MQGQRGDTTAVIWYCRGIVRYLKRTPLRREWRASNEICLDMDRITQSNRICQAADDSVICSLRVYLA